MKISRYIKSIGYWLLPYSCALCYARTSNTLLCDPCHLDLPWLTSVCLRCSNPLTINDSALPYCGACLNNPPPYYTTIALFNYQPPIDHLILKLKFHQKLMYANLFGQLLADRITAHYPLHCQPDYIIPMPLHKARLRERGYNQALELARPLAKRLKIPLEITHCTRHLATQPQYTLSALDRQQNIKNAFKIHPAFQAQHVAIVDDIVTTGSTVTEFAHVLQEAGVPRIDIWCCAHTQSTKGGV